MKSERELAETIRHIVLDAERHWYAGDLKERERYIRTIDRIMADLRVEGIAVLEEAEVER